MRTHTSNKCSESIGTRAMIKASLITFEDGRNLENVIKDLEKKIDDLKSGAKSSLI